MEIREVYGLIDEAKSHFSTEMAGLREDIQKILLGQETVIKDHDKRLNFLERERAFIRGAFATIAGIGGALTLIAAWMAVIGKFHVSIGG